MNIKHAELEINTESPFTNCQLSREPYANILTEIITTYANGFVLALNGEWGTGKTTFVKMWKQKLENSNYQTLYFNAWETDFEENPLIALIAEFKTLTHRGNDEIFKSLLSKGAVLAKNLAPQLIRSLAEHYILTKAVIDTIENATKSATEILESEIEQYNKKKEGIKEFKETLQNLVETVEKNKPIVFIIDELDRCRPSYSVALLEQIKHLFSVPGIVFVLSIDKEQLGNAVRGVYGSDRINADEYLRRFIDLEYALPQPDTKMFVTYLYNYFGFSQILESDQRKAYFDYPYESESLVTTASLLFEKSNLALRKQEKILSHARIAIRSLRANQYLFSTLFIYLVYLKNHNLSIFEKIQRKSYSTIELLNEFYKTFPKGIEKHDLNVVINLEATLTCMYESYINELGCMNLIQKDKDTDIEKVTVKSNFDKSEDQHQFRRFINFFIQKHDYRGVSIKLILDRINMTQIM